MNNVGEECTRLAGLGAVNEILCLCAEIIEYACEAQVLVLT